MIYIGIEGVVEGGGGGLRWKSLLSRVFKKGFVYLLFVLWKYINLKGLSCQFLIGLLKNNFVV